MAEVTLRFDELEANDLPAVCIVCGARRGVQFVRRRFLWRPLFAPPGLVMMLATRRVAAEVPLCPAHGGPRLFAHQRFAWWGLTTVAVGADRLTLGRVSGEFADALERWREKRWRSGIDEPPPRRPRVQVGRGPGGGGTALKVLGILAAVMTGLVALMVVGMLSVMAVGVLFLQKAVPPSAPPPPAPGPIAVEPRPEGVVVGLMAVAPCAGGPAALPWAPLALSARKKTFHLLEDAEIDRALADLKSPNPAEVEKAARRFSQAAPDPARRPEAAAALTAAATNPFPSARRAAAAGLAVWGAADDAPTLGRLLADPFPDVRTAAVAALAGLRGPGADAAALPELEKATRDPDPGVARAAAAAVKAIRDRRNPEENHP